MMLKLLRYGALLFFIWGIYAEEHLLYFFFALHLSVLSIGVFLHQQDSKANHAASPSESNKG